MDNANGDKPSQPPARESELLPAMMAIALAVAAQLALEDDLALLGLAGYIVAAWLFVASVRGIFDSAPSQAVEAGERADSDSEAVGVAPGEPAESTSRLDYLRQNWRLVTIAEIFRGDIPSARLQGQSPGPLLKEQPGDRPNIEDARALTGEEKPVTSAARVDSWAASESSASAPKAVKVTAQGDVLVLDAGLGQVQRFDKTGNLLATYSLSGMADLEVLDLAVSPDGQTLYIVDAASKRLQVITLTDDDSAGEEE